MTWTAIVTLNGGERATHIDEASFDRSMQAADSTHFRMATEWPQELSPPRTPVGITHAEAIVQDAPMGSPACCARPSIDGDLRRRTSLDCEAV